MSVSALLQWVSSVAFSNPFICALVDSEQCPSFTEQGFPFWTYLMTLAVGGPLTSMTQGYVISRLTGEWTSGRSFKREMCITSMVLFLTSPFMAVSYKAALEGSFGRVYHTESSFLATLMQVFLFNVVADTWFYWVHRMFHEVSWLYQRSHYLHHSAHPVNTFMGNGGDVFELITQGELQVFIPTLFVPIHARYFVLNSLLMQGYTLWLHNGKRFRLPALARKIIIDPFDHNIHHYFGRRNYNYALYFTVWDRLMGTHKESVQAFEKPPSVASPYLNSPAEVENVQQQRLAAEAQQRGSSSSLSFLVWRAFKLCMLIHESPAA